MIKWFPKVFRRAQSPEHARPADDRLNVPVENQRTAIPAAPTNATLVIPDLHNDFARAEAAIQQLAGRYTWIVFLGDYFDDTGDTPETALLVAEWLKRSLGEANRIHLVGNHDLAYLCPSSFTRCSGFTAEKLRAVTPLLDALPKEKFRAAIEAEGWLLSHAGFHPCHSSGRTAPTLVAQADAALRAMEAGERPVLFAAGTARGGTVRFGGISWCDWSREFLPTAGLHQITGHTTADTVRLDYLDSVADNVTRRQSEVSVESGEVVSQSGHLSMNVCLDTHLRCVALIEGGTLTLIPAPAER